MFWCVLEGVFVCGFSSSRKRDRERLRRHPAEVENMKGNKELKTRQIMAAQFKKHPTKKENQNLAKLGKIGQNLALNFFSNKFSQMLP